MADRAVRVNGIEHRADDVEGRRERRAAVADKEADCLSHSSFQRAVVQKGVHASVEDDILRTLRVGFRDVEGLKTRFQGPALCVELALHDVVLAIDRGRPPPGSKRIRPLNSLAVWIGKGGRLAGETEGAGWIGFHWEVFF